MQDISKPLNRTIQVNADEAVLHFNYVAGQVYRNDQGDYVLPAHNGIQDWVCDCYVISAEDWENGVTPSSLEAMGELPVPVRTEDRGVAFGWLDDILAARELQDAEGLETPRLSNHKKRLR